MRRDDDHLIWNFQRKQLVESITYAESCKIIHDHENAVPFLLFLTLSIADQQSLSPINKHALTQLSIFETSCPIANSSCNTNPIAPFGDVYIRQAMLAVAH